MPACRTPPAEHPSANGVVAPPLFIRWDYRQTSGTRQATALCHMPNDDYERFLPYPVITAKSTIATSAHA